MKKLENLLILLGPVALVALFILLLVGMIAAAVRDDLKWEAFKQANNCKVVSKISGDVFNTFAIGSNGSPVVGIGATPDKTGWACADGITYYR